MIGRSKRTGRLSIPLDPYPEIGFERTLGRVILETIHRSNNATDLQDESAHVYETTFRKGRRLVYITVASNKRKFLSSFSWKGVTLADFTTADLREVARAVDFWLTRQMGLRDMKDSIVNFEVSDMAFEIEAGRGVTARWEFLLSPAPWLKPECVALLRAASSRPLLRRLFPVVSLCHIVSFSRTIGYPFSDATPYCLCAGYGHYGILRQDLGLVKEGTIYELLDIVEQSLPPDTGPAIFGTAEDLNADSRS